MVRPTNLASSESPARLRRLPNSSDLLVVVNQVSPDEIRRGYRRGRLSSAISKDGGKTWEHFKTLEQSAGLLDVEQVVVGEPAGLVRAMPYVGDLPDDYSIHAYPDVSFAGGLVFLS